MNEIFNAIESLSFKRDAKRTLKNRANNAVKHGGLGFFNVILDSLILVCSEKDTAILKQIKAITFDKSREFFEKEGCTK